MTVATPDLDGPKTGLMAVPFQPTPAKMQTVLQAVADHPWWFNSPATEQERAVAAATLLADPFNRVWEVWQGGKFVGLLILWRIQPKVDAVFHFIFFDQNLIGKRALILGFLGHLFADPDLGLRRVSMEVPTFKLALLSFARRKLGFTFEGEAEVRKLVVQHGLRVKDPYRANHKESMDVVLASAGSRREAAHWHDGRWHDVLCLKLTAAEYERFMEG